MALDFKHPWAKTKPLITYHIFKVNMGLVQQSLLEKEISSLENSRREVRLELNDFIKVFQGLVVFSQSEKHQGSPEVRLVVIRVTLNGGMEVSECIGKLTIL